MLAQVLADDRMSRPSARQNYICFHRSHPVHEGISSLGIIASGYLLQATAEFYVEVTKLRTDWNMVLGQTKLSGRLFPSLGNS